LEIYNIKGQKVTTLINDLFEAGSHKVTWNATDQSSGIYLLRFNTDGKSETKKLILLKQLTNYHSMALGVNTLYQ